MPEQPKPRRAPASSDRKRDADRSRERILDAALMEFGEHGYAGARIGAIARRAGVNQQLISYYFDGKEGLHRALMRRWRDLSAALSPADAPLAEVVGRFAHVGEEQRHWARLLVWQELSGFREEGQEEFRRSMVSDLRRRQSAGEVGEDLDAPFLMLALFGATLAPTVLPALAEDFTGLKPDSPEFIDRYRDVLRRVIERLA